MSISRAIASEARGARGRAKRLVNRRVEKYAFTIAILLAVGGVAYELFKKPPAS